MYCQPWQFPNPAQYLPHNISLVALWTERFLNLINTDIVLAWKCVADSPTSRDSWSVMYECPCPSSTKTCHFPSNESVTVDSTRHWAMWTMVRHKWVIYSLVSSPCSCHRYEKPSLLPNYPGPLFTKKTPSYQYRDSHYIPETVVRPS